MYKVQFIVYLQYKTHEAIIHTYEAYYHEWPSNELRKQQCDFVVDHHRGTLPVRATEPVNVS